MQVRTAISDDALADSGETVDLVATVTSGTTTNANASGTGIFSSGFSVRIVRGCDALEPTAAFVAAVLASPVVFRRKLPGLLIGVPSMLTINLGRVVSLFFIGIHFPSIFETAHYEIWQAAFIVLAVAFWAIWVQWATRDRRKKPEAQPE